MQFLLRLVVNSSFQIIIMRSYDDLIKQDTEGQKHETI
jgi:hypothetical protein